MSSELAGTTWRIVLPLGSGVFSANRISPDNASTAKLAGKADAHILVGRRFLVARTSR